MSFPDCFFPINYLRATHANQEGLSGEIERRREEVAKITRRIQSKEGSPFGLGIGALGDIIAYNRARRILELYRGVVYRKYGIIA